VGVGVVVVLRVVVFKELVGRADGGGGGGKGLRVVGKQRLIGETFVLLHVWGQVLVELCGDKVAHDGGAASVHSHAAEDFDVIMNFKGGVEFKVVLGSFFFFSGENLVKHLRKK